MLIDMIDLHHLELPQLVDLLAKQTEVVSKHFTEKRFDQAYEEEKQFLKLIQAEIDFRKNVVDVVSTKSEQTAGLG